MPVTHKNRQGKTYFLHSGPKRGGGKQFFVSTSPDGELAEAIPDGFEIYETVNGAVYLRKKRVSAIRPEEIEIIERELKKNKGKNRYKLEVRAKEVVLHESTGSSILDDLRPRFLSQRSEELAESFAQYMAIMRFTLVDAKARSFAPERYCFRGSVDDWISIGPPGSLAKIVPTYFKHLGKDSFFDLCRF